MDISIDEYQKAALSELLSAGVQALDNASFLPWISEMHSRKVPIAGLIEKWAENKHERDYETKLGYLGKELTRYLESETYKAEKTANKAGDTATAVELIALATDNAETLIEAQAKERVYRSYLKAIATSRAEKSETASQLFERLKLYSARELAQLAMSGMNQSTSWLTNAQSRARLAATGAVVAVCLDIDNINL